jgi:hypothetical protein
MRIRFESLADFVQSLSSHTNHLTDPLLHTTEDSLHFFKVDQHKI